MDNNQPVALVTGGGKGIGLAVGQRLLADGYRVVLNLHSQPDEELQAQLAAFTIMVGDVSQEDQASEIVNAIMDQFGRLDVLVNNAGITRDGLLTRIKLADFNDVIATNLTGSFNMTKFAMKVMQKSRQGAIINITSISGTHGNLGQANYAASKAGLVGLTKTAAKEGALRGIRCNAVAPGMVTTAMTAKMSEKRQEQFSEQIPLKRFGQPEEIADAVAFLARNEYITGQVITVDGGLTI